MKKTFITLSLFGLFNTSNLSAAPFNSPLNISTEKNQVSAPFAEFPHHGQRRPHAAYDLRTTGNDTPATAVNAVVSGKVQYMPELGAFGGSCKVIELIPDDKTKISRILYLHSKGLVVPNGSRVAAGQKIAMAGESCAPGAPHLHFSVMSVFNRPKTQVYTSSVNGALMQGMTLIGDGIKAPDRKGEYAVDPYPFFGVPFKFKKGSIAAQKYGDTKRYYEAMNNGKSEIFDVQNIDDASMSEQTGNNNMSDEEKANFLFEMGGETYGGTVESFVSDEDISFSERLRAASLFRFSSDKWAFSIVAASNRALYADYVAANGLEVFLKNEIQKKRNHIEALFATLASQKIKESKKNAIYAFNNSQSTNISNAIK